MYTITELSVLDEAPSTSRVPTSAPRAAAALFTRAARAVHGAAMDRAVQRRLDEIWRQHGADATRRRGGILVHVHYDQFRTALGLRRDFRYAVQIGIGQTPAQALRFGFDDPNAGSACRRDPIRPNYRARSWLSRRGHGAIVNRVVWLH